MEYPLSPYRALVGGSTQGIGRAVAEALAERGATVTLLARNQARLRETAAALPTPEGQKHDFLVADFNQPDHLNEVVTTYLREHPAGFQILINNTGGPAGGPPPGGTGRGLSGGVQPAPYLQPLAGAGPGAGDAEGGLWPHHQHYQHLR